MEYLLVTGLIMLVIVPSIYIFYSYSHKSNEEIAQSQVNRFGTQIIDAAEEIYYLGGPSKTTLDLTMPKGVKGMEIWRNQELVFFLNDGSEISFKSMVNITSNIACTGRCYYTFTDRFYSQGIKHVVVIAKGDHVLITLKDEDEYIDSFTHRECIDGKCVYLSGSGPDLCYDNAWCLLINNLDGEYIPMYLWGVLQNSPLYATAIDGNIGVGTTEPDSKLSVNGSMSIIDNLTVDHNANFGKLYFNGITARGNLNMNSYTITGLPAPIRDSDIATKEYVDSIVNGG